MFQMFQLVIHLISNSSTAIKPYEISNTVDQCMYTSFEDTEGFGMKTPKKFFGLLQYLRKPDRQVNILPTGAQCHLLVFSICAAAQNL